jgi:hypothetical protein
MGKNQPDQPTLTASEQICKLGGKVTSIPQFAFPKPPGRSLAERNRSDLHCTPHKDDGQLPEERAR